MKTVILTVFLCGFVVLLQAQSSTSVPQKDSISIFNNDIKRPAGLDSKIEYKADDTNVFEKYHNCKNKKSSKLQAEKAQVLEMPCYYPDGSFSMPVCKPDSTVTYSLLIKTK
nr:hypothetical protein [uncultured Carboxylicivirga sp.]